MTLISIIIPCFNIEDYIEDCVNSIIVQNPKNIEILLIDDGSNDNTPIICKKLSNKYNYIQFIQNKHRGVSHARNTGIFHSNGKYIWFVDGDDLINEDTFNNLEKYLIYDSDIIILKSRTKLSIDNDNYRVYSNKFMNKLEDIFATPQINKNIYDIEYITWDLIGWNKLFSKEFIITHNIQFDEELDICNDLLFTLTAYSNNPNITITDVLSYYWLIRPSNNSLTQKYTSKKIKQYINYFEKSVNLINSQPNSFKKEVYTRWVNCEFIDFIQILLQSQNNSEYLNKFKKIFTIMSEDI